MDSIDKLAVTCKQLYDIRIVEQRQEIERLKKINESENQHTIKIWEKSNLEYYFQVPKGFCQFINNKVYDGVLLKFDGYTSDITLSSNLLRYIWYSYAFGLESDNPHLWIFDSEEIKNNCIQALQSALTAWNQYLKSRINVQHNLGKLTVMK